MCFSTCQNRLLQIHRVRSHWRGKIVYYSRVLFSCMFLVIHIVNSIFIQNCMFSYNWFYSSEAYLVQGQSYVLQANIMYPIDNATSFVPIVHACSSMLFWRHVLIQHREIETRKTTRLKFMCFKKLFYTFVFPSTTSDLTSALVARPSSAISKSYSFAFHILNCEFSSTRWKLIIRPQGHRKQTQTSLPNVEVERTRALTVALFYSHYYSPASVYNVFKHQEEKEKRAPTLLSFMTKKCPLLLLSGIPLRTRFPCLS
jgi:hypothetical protein